MIYKCKVYLNKQTEAGASELYFTFSETEFKDLKKKASFLPGPVEFSRGGGKSVADMLSKMSEEEAEQYLNKIKIDNPDLFTNVKKYFFLFDDIIKMPEKMALDFWGDPDIDLAMMA